MNIEFKSDLFKNAIMEAPLTDIINMWNAYCDKIGNKILKVVKNDENDIAEFNIPQTLLDSILDDISGMSPNDDYMFVGIVVKNDGSLKMRFMTVTKAVLPKLLSNRLINNIVYEFENRPTEDLVNFINHYMGDWLDECGYHNIKLDEKDREKYISCSHNTSETNVEVQS